MRKKVLLILAVIALSAAAYSADTKKGLEPFTYKEDFETNELSAWASYPLWQDTAYDPNMRPDTPVPGDPNIALCQRVTPYSNVDNYAGAQKLLDMVFLEDSTIELRAYLKTHLQPEYLKVRLAAGPDGAVDYTVARPAPNSWQTVRVRREDLARENPRLKGRPIKVNALAVLAKFPGGDPSMPIYLALDDVVFKGARPAHFQFAEPRMHKLSEWKAYIPDKHYQKGESLIVKGRWAFPADRVEIAIADFTNASKTVLRSALRRNGGEWAGSFKLAFPEGLYLGTLTAYSGKAKIAATEFTVFIDPGELAGSHPRLWFDSRTIEAVKSRAREERFKSVRNEILTNAKSTREKNPVDKLVFDVDRFPDDEPLIGNLPRSLSHWSRRTGAWRNTLRSNALAYAILGDEEAGRFVKDYLVKLCQFPVWVHPWFEKRGQHTYYPAGELAMDAALAYDSAFNLMTDAERKIVRDGLFRNMIVPGQKGYIEDNLVTNNTSNWVAHVTGGLLMAQTAIFADAPAERPVEPYLTGALFKLYDLILKSSGRDGGYGESAGYCYFTMQSLSKVLPALANVFKIDLSGTLHLTYADLLWAGLIQKKEFFYFGDSGYIEMSPMMSWTWLLAKNRDPYLSWLFNHLKQGETVMDVIHDTDGIPGKNPFSENPVRLFRDLGTTVFKSGWEADDFVFVLRTGPFYNHQHLDQGTFWLADKGDIFVEERHGSSYYDDPYYQSHYTQAAGHSTILIDHNEQSQRAGDPLVFAEGFNDRAFVSHFLDGKDAAFVSGDIGRLYWGKVKGMQRNVIYLKPRTVLMLDTVVPADKDVDVTLLYQTGHLKDIAAGAKASQIARDNGILSIHHLHPEAMSVKAEKTPIYINTLRDSSPLEAEGLLAATARTEGKPLVMANLLTTDGKDLKIKTGAGHVAGLQAGKEFAFSTDPGTPYKAGGFDTDALALAWSKNGLLAALCTTLSRDGALLVSSEEPITCEFTKSAFKYYLAGPSKVSIGLAEAPRRILLNGAPVKAFKYDKGAKTLILTLEAGEGVVTY
ncbi:MAG: heparinase II/III family protein [Acidobacteriota bacterium]|nr:heparinase II/III family protein [Acidobacteriota bacterium]